MRQRRFSTQAKASSKLRIRARTLPRFNRRDDWCKMVQFEIKKDSKECYYKPLAAGYYRSYDGSESTCTIGNVATGWLSRNYNDPSRRETRTATN